MLARVLSVGLLAGLLAGLLIAVLQQVTTTPLILLAETYEKAEAAAAPPASGASAVRRAGVLQRLLRDGSCLQHHISANQVSHELTGRVRCGIGSAFVFKGETVQNAVTTSSALGHKETHAPQQIIPSFDHLIGPRKQRRWERKT